jgi:hypothetical protein
MVLAYIMFWLLWTFGVGMICYDWGSRRAEKQLGKAALAERLFDSLNNDGGVSCEIGAYDEKEQLQALLIVIGVHADAQLKVGTQRTFRTLIAESEKRSAASNA